MSKCKYEGSGVLAGRCTGTKEVDPCPGYDKCKNFKPNYTSNGNQIRAMSDEELARLLSSLAFNGETPWSAPFMVQICMSCPTFKATLIEGGEEMELHECDFVDGKCPHGDEVIWWLKQPAETMRGHPKGE